MDNKTCTKCRESKPIAEFHKASKSKDGHKSSCKACRKTEDPGAGARAKRYYENNKERVLSYVKEYAKQNPEVVKRAQKVWLEKNGFVYQERWKLSHPDKVVQFASRRQATLKAATPRWADNKSIREFYDEARKKTASTGVPYEVDHIVPLQSKIVCGLHVSQNLQVVTRRENAAKHNLRWPDMP